ncbi:hypothetical protein CSX04_07122 [Burkholderia cepacia]|nr:hypothetical protein CSX04_07122 [Burkholderia cepacia]
MQATDFSDTELADLHAHGIVLFADRVIFDAQPPMPADQIAAVQARCHGDLPPALLELWRTTAGGSLDYDLTLEMNGHIEAISWGELFYNGSNGYRDLEGWIDHELELAEEAADEHSRPWSGRLDVLPFGGFEYCDRIYVVTDPDAKDRGHVLAWKQGLPPAWRGAMHEDGLATVAPDLYAAFGALQLDADPLEPGGEHGTGATLLDYIDDRQAEHGLSASLGDKVIAFYRRAVIDWRTPLADARSPPNRRSRATRCDMRSTTTTPRSPCNWYRSSRISARHSPAARTRPTMRCGERNLSLRAHC